MMETGGCEECVRLIDVTGSTSCCAWNILYDIVFRVNFVGGGIEGIVNAGIIPRINEVISKCSWEHQKGLHAMKWASMILRCLACHDAVISPGRMSTLMLVGGGLNTLCSLIEMDYNKKCEDSTYRYHRDVILSNYTQAVKYLYRNPSYHRPLNNFRRMRSRYDTRSRFTALLDEIQGVVRGVD